MLSEKLVKNKFFLIISFVCFLLLLPSFFLPWSLIDDGQMVLNSQKILEAIRSFNLGAFISVFWESGVGRFRPAYWSYNFLAFLLGGNNPFFYHFLRFVNFAGVGYLIFHLTYEISKSKRAAIFSFLLFTFSFLTFENWYRLGPQEPLTTLLLALVLYFLLKRKVSFVFYPILFLLFLKETNIVLIPVLIFITFFNIKMKLLDRRELNKLLGRVILLGLLVIAALYFVGSGSYGSNYQLNSKTLAENVLSYLSLIRTYLGYLPIVALVIFLWRKKTKEELFWLTNILMFSLFLFISFLPWQFPLGRYLLPMLFFLSIFMGVEIDGTLEILKRYRILCLILFFYLVGVLLQNAIIMTGTFYGYFQRENVNGELVSYLASETEPEKTLYLNFVNDNSTVEYFDELKMHLGLFYGRDDLKFQFLEKASEPPTGDLIVEGYLSPNIPDLSGHTLLRSFERNARTPIVTTPIGFLTRMIRWVIGLTRGEQSLPEGIYTFYQGHYFWRVYRVT